jgi:N-acetyl-gamma-glutamyl-phosphate/LysW-gamma-L-alpha-aminoadipyl-6-phosphate reductase
VSESDGVSGGDKVRLSIVGGSGYAGGELLRLALDHPHLEVGQVTSERLAGKFVHTAHPNLRGRTQLKFTPLSQLEPCDALVLGLPHGSAQGKIDHYAELAGKVLLDMSADFRLRDPALYEKTYGEAHQAPARLNDFVYGLPELHREELKGAKFVSGVGCNATASNLALLPLARAGLLDLDKPIVVDLKVGSSEAGNKNNPGSHHPERSGVVRSFAPAGHRHAAEVEQELGLPGVHMSVTSVELVRGALATAHAFLKEDLADKDLWKAYRGAYKPERFVRIVKDRTGIHRYPEPKLLAGTNWADVGFAVEPGTRRVVSICAIDNLMKGAAGSALQSLNLALGWEEDLGLGFPGLHPL